MSGSPEDDGLSATRDAESGARASSTALPPGTVIGEYTIEALVGRGGMGAVYSARQPLIGKRVAIKLLLDALPDDPSVVRRFIDEARAVNKIGHPNIVDIFSFGRLPDNRLYFVMELLPGGTLRDRLLRGPLEPSETERYVKQICSALGAAHAELIVHRDLKPENIWITTPKHGEPYIKLLDFGIAKLAESQAPGPGTATGIVMGTPHFMSPEQCQGGQIDHRTDIYALGVILYEMFAGRLPFQGDSAVNVLMQHVAARPTRPSEFRAVAPELEALILACLEKDPEARPQSTAELSARFEAAMRGTGSQPSAASATSEPPPLHVPSSAALSSDALRPFAATQPATTPPPVLVSTPAPARRTARALWLVIAALLLVGAGSWIYVSRTPTDSELARPAASVESEREPVRPSSPAAEVSHAQPAAEAPTPQVAEPQPPPATPETIAPPPARPQAPLRSKHKTHTEKQAPSRVEKAGLVTDNPF